MKRNRIMFNVKKGRFYIQLLCPYGPWGMFEKWRTIEREINGPGTPVYVTRWFETRMEAEKYLREKGLTR